MACLLLPTVLLRCLVELTMVALGLRLARVDLAASRALVLAGLVFLLGSLGPVAAEGLGYAGMFWSMSQQLDPMAHPWIIGMVVLSSFLSITGPPLFQAVATGLVAYAMVRLRNRRRAE